MSVGWGRWNTLYTQEARGWVLTVQRYWFVFTLWGVVDNWCEVREVERFIYTASMGCQGGAPESYTKWILGIWWYCLDLTNNNILSYHYFIITSHTKHSWWWDFTNSFWIMLSVCVDCFVKKWGCGLVLYKFIIIRSWTTMLYIYTLPFCKNRETYSHWSPLKVEQKLDMGFMDSNGNSTHFSVDVWYCNDIITNGLAELGTMDK